MRKVCQYFPDKPFPMVSECSTRIKLDDCGCPQLRFDESRLSYPLLAGIVLNKGKSWTFFTEIIEDTLKKEYGIECFHGDNIPYRREASSETCIVPADWESYILSDSEYAEIQKKLRKGETLCEREKKKMLLYKIIVLKLGIHQQHIDLHLLQMFTEVFSTKQGKIKNAWNTLYRLKRLESIMRNTPTDNRMAFLNTMDKMTDYKKDRDGNIDMHTNMIKKQFELIIECQSFMNFVCDIDNLMNGTIAINEGAMKQSYENYRNSIPDEQFNTLMKNLGVQAKDREKMRVCTVVDKIIKEGCGLDLVFAEGTKDKRHENYKKDGVYTLKIDKWLNFIKSYQPNVSFKRTHDLNTYAFIDGVDD
jgi:hypothetical protein